MELSDFRVSHRYSVTLSIPPTWRPRFRSLRWRHCTFSAVSFPDHYKFAWTINFRRNTTL